MEIYEVYSFDPDNEDNYMDLSLAVQSAEEMELSADTVIYVFTWAEAWREMPDGTMDYCNPEGFESKLLRVMTLEEARGSIRDDEED